MRSISRFRLRVHTLKVEAAVWLEDGSCVCDQCPGEDEHVQNKVHALLFCQDLFYFAKTNSMIEFVS